MGDENDIYEGEPDELDRAVNGVQDDGEEPTEGGES
jgi:hypothetical protein